MGSKLYSNPKYSYSDPKYSIPKYHYFQLPEQSKTPYFTPKYKTIPEQTDNQKHIPSRVLLCPQTFLTISYD